MYINNYTNTKFLLSFRVHIFQASFYSLVILHTLLQMKSITGNTSFWSSYKVGLMTMWDRCEAKWVTSRR